MSNSVNMPLISFVSDAINLRESILDLRDALLSTGIKIGKGKVDFSKRITDICERIKLLAQKGKSIQDSQPSLDAEKVRLLTEDPESLFAQLQEILKKNGSKIGPKKNKTLDAVVALTTQIDKDVTAAEKLGFPDAILSLRIAFRFRQFKKFLSLEDSSPSDIALFNKFIAPLKQRAEEILPNYEERYEEFEEKVRIKLNTSSECDSLYDQVCKMTGVPKQYSADFDVFFKPPYIETLLSVAERLRADISR